MQMSLISGRVWVCLCTFVGLVTGRVWSMTLLGPHSCFSFWVGTGCIQCVWGRGVCSVGGGKARCGMCVSWAYLVVADRVVCLEGPVWGTACSILRLYGVCRVGNLRNQWWWTIVRESNIASDFYIFLSLFCIWESKRQTLKIHIPFYVGYV